MTAAATVLAHALAGPALLGGGRLICIDGPAGSGKTTLAAAIAAETPATVLHLDDLYPGWDGLPAVGAVIAALLADLAAGRPGRYRRYDWFAEELREEHSVSPTPLLILEGVGSGDRAWSQLTDTLVWVEAPEAERLARAVARDGDGLRRYWQAWSEAEAAHFAAERTRERADLVFGT